jgi:hypothetical protein
MLMLMLMSLNWLSSTSIPIPTSIRARVGTRACAISTGFVF